MGGHSSEGWWEQSGRAGVQVMSYPRSVNVQAVQRHWRRQGGLSRFGERREEQRKKVEMS